MVGLNDGALGFALAPDPAPIEPTGRPEAKAGAVYEVAPLRLP